MRHLADQRCFNHAGREAVARCLDCRRYYCRECITEHDHRVLCAGCLAKLVRLDGPKARGRGWVPRLGQAVLGLAMAWFFFYLLGEILLSIPTRVHEGTVWRMHWWDKP